MISSSGGAEPSDLRNELSLNDTNPGTKGRTDVGATTGDDVGWGNAAGGGVGLGDDLRPDAEGDPSVPVGIG
jgi:hypothetical protein